MNVTITIPTPVLTPPDFFKVRYHALPDGAWVNLPNQTNAPFTVDLPAGEYELEITPVIGGVECPPVVLTIPVNESRPCIEVVGAYIAVDSYGNGMNITLPYVGSVPSPDCGWIIEYGSIEQWNDGMQSTITYATLPPSPIVLPYTPSESFSNFVRITADYCTSTTVCYVAAIQRTVDVPCDPISNFDVTVQNVGGVFYLTATWQQGTPPTLSATIGYVQTDIPLYMGADTWNAPIAIVPTQTSYTMQINPTIGNHKTIRYLVVMNNICGQSFSKEVTFELSL